MAPGDQLGEHLHEAPCVPTPPRIMSFNKTQNQFGLHMVRGDLRAGAIADRLGRVTEAIPITPEARPII
jgi:hypothetical protein